MKNSTSKIDIVGVVIFLLIFLNCILEIYSFNLIGNYSLIQSITWQFCFYPISGLLLISKSIWSKLFALVISLSITISSYGALLYGLQIIHHFYSQGMSFLEITPLILLTIVTLYSSFAILIKFCKNNKIETKLN